MNELNANTSREIAVIMVERLINQWIEQNEDTEPLADVILTAAIDLHTRALGELGMADYLRAIADQLEGGGDA